eukprot:TRINITY_DN2608_c0_g1_i1.p1 TRINITY_DN2608_c0_g1~~TRINITY_DN2608_c0_g1_i1.p1  ORF type:complete len:163 (-),score=41.78 TRINITY_DN2608_c0_g1_i1:290-778(-)
MAQQRSTSTHPVPWHAALMEALRWGCSDIKARCCCCCLRGGVYAKLPLSDELEMAPTGMFDDESPHNQRQYLRNEWDRTVPSAPSVETAQQAEIADQAGRIRRLERTNAEIATQVVGLEMALRLAEAENAKLKQACQGMEEQMDAAEMEIAELKGEMTEMKR